MSPIPEFDSNGFLPTGIHACRGSEFLERFMFTDARKEYEDTILNIIDFAAHYGAKSVLVGGSFVTSERKPHDIDCVIVFQKQNQIPPRIESLDIGGNSVDIFFASQDQTQLVASFLKLMSTSRFEEKVGVIDIQIINGSERVWDVTFEPDEEIFEIVRSTYTRRHIVHKTPRKKTLVTIHGIRTHAEWNAEITLNASSNGWMVAPFQYGYTEASVFFSKDKRRKIVDEFRDFLADLKQTYGAQNISVIAHSFGTYIACNYILGFDRPPILFDTLILCGAIVDADLNLDRFEEKVAHIVNEHAPNDEWADWAKPANFGKDELFGYAGTQGFSENNERLLQLKSNIFTHNNVIKRDVISQRWMPLLEANCGSINREIISSMIKRNKVSSLKVTTPSKSSAIVPKVKLMSSGHSENGS